MVQSKYRYISGKKLLQELDRHYGLDIVGQRGSHIKIQLKTTHKKTVIPNHKELAYGTFSAILAQLHVDEDEFLSLM